MTTKTMHTNTLEINTFPKRITQITNFIRDHEQNIIPQQSIKSAHISKLQKINETSWYDHEY